MAKVKSVRHDGSFPRLPFFIVRFLQLLCCIVVLGVLGYFQYYLWKDGYSTPYEFALLDFAASTTLLNIFVTSIFILCCGLSATYVIIIDTILTILWAVCVGLLLRAMGKTTTRACSVKNWGNDDGVRVCHMFKAMAAFSMFALFSFFGMVVTAVIIRKKASTHQYQPAPNPVILQNLNNNTAYEPPRTSMSGPPPAYNPPENFPAAAKPIQHHNPNYYG